MDRWRHSPAVSNHADSLCFSRAVKFGRLLHVLLATNAFGIAVAGFDQSIRVAPVSCNFVAAKRKGLILGSAPTIHVTFAKLVDCDSVLCTMLLRSEERRVGKECRSRWRP